MSETANRAEVALVLVSHSRDLARGAAELAGQMAPGVLLLPVGGTADGGIGTDFDGVQAAIEQGTADGGSVVVLTDLGSAVLTTESVLEFLDDEVQARVSLADAPFVEGAAAAAVTAHGGAHRKAVLDAAEHAGHTFAPHPDAPPPDAPPKPTTGEQAPLDDGVARAQVTLRNKLGLHARPAAVVARMLAGYDAKVRVNGVNAASVLELMKLGATEGHSLTIEAEGPQAQAARDALVDAVESGFGEL
ncbi:dihydroxyacetone kinase phosphoryl donor subunit DhaM [Cellulomonas alba]|uniref:Phosphocarrier protein HPr n=1 Tax=Cellulomonas alba TaxID=3053467 RepID=A0ABT7SIP4_9CELL|nr:dihydroxyacetone kinase phosphoryl donor subunit DhaM [Cellulomonas alba]MDM7856056.1 dihydroxyacetone kinase phosphoryl donor subunit DhaM [Cellulomonas alba]